MVDLVRVPLETVCSLEQGRQGRQGRTHVARAACGLRRPGMDCPPGGLGPALQTCSKFRAALQFFRSIQPHLGAGCVGAPILDADLHDLKQAACYRDIRPACTWTHFVIHGAPVLHASPARARHTSQHGVAGLARFSPPPSSLPPRQQAHLSAKELEAVSSQVCLNVSAAVSMGSTTCNRL